MGGTLELRIPVGALDSLSRRVRDAAGGDLQGFRVERRSLDARRGREACWQLVVRTWGRDETPPEPPLREPRMPTRRRPAPPVAVVGAGPAGLFAALGLAEAGVPVELFDQGAGFPRRHFDVRDLRYEGVLHPHSNYRFGLGGAGTYSDGKLFTRNRGPAVREVLETLAWLAGDEALAVDARPHVGTNRLIPVLTRLRAWLEAAGVRLHLDTRVEGLRIHGGTVAGVRLSGEDVEAAAVVLAPGNAARDTLGWLAATGVALESRPAAVGVRVEHPRELIDRIQLGRLAGHPELGAAEYRFAFPVGSRGAYSFCMCPGGHVLPVPAEIGGLAINGASHRARASGFSNAALVVTAGPADWEGRHPGPLGGIGLQRELETAAFRLGGGGYRAPAQRVPDFLAARVGSLPSSSYRPGLTPADVGSLFPDAIRESLREGLRVAGRVLRGYDSAEGLVIGVETTTGAVVRILRDPAGESVSHRGLFPCGEGAGYAGGITSSAADGLELGRRLAERLSEIRPWGPASTSSWSS